jgi:serpin B
MEHRKRNGTKLGKARLVNGAMAIILLALVGCSPAPAAAVAQSDKERVTAPSVDPADLETLVEGNSGFAFDLYRQLSQGDGNLFYSPHSISLALAMAYAGAAGETEQQMAQALHYVLPQERLHPAFNALDQELAQRGEGAEGKDEGGFRLNVVNATWGQNDYEFLPGYLDVLAENYGAGLRLLDFVGDPEGSRATINDWANQETEGRIKDLIPEGVINGLTRLVLTNAIYFNAAWAHPFSEGATTDGPFTLLDGSEVGVPMMYQSESFLYGEGDGYQAVVLPYDGHELAMAILLPDAGTFEAFEDALDAEAVDTMLSNLALQEVELTMPKFEFESSFNLVAPLSALGMADAFSSKADFSRMTGNRELSIDDVIHKSFVSVDEEGTEAAAATAVIMELTAALPEEPVKMVLDHPFVFLIRDVQTGAILFVGRVADPSV